MADVETTQRLAFSRYLFQLAMEQSQAPEPLNAVAVLMFQDVVELVLHLALEHLNVSAKSLAFEEYFDQLEKRLGVGAIQGRVSMRRLNKSRVALKHHGTLPAQIDIDAFRASVADFLEVNVPALFGIQYADVSLAALIADDAARVTMQRADKLRSEGDIPGTMEALSLTFELLLRSVRDATVAEFKTPYLRHLGRGDFDGLTGEFRSLISGLVKSVTQLQDEVRVLRLGLNPNRLRAFRRLVPHVAVAVSGVHAAWRDPNAQIATDAELQYCYFFVVECALQLQKLDSLPSSKAIQGFAGSR
jgi:hypothetical protein